MLCGLRGLGFRVWDPGFEANGLRFKRLRDKAGSAHWGFHSFKQTFWMQVLKEPVEVPELLWSEVPCVSKSSVYFLALVFSCRASCQAPRCFRLIKPDVQGLELKSLSVRESWANSLSLSKNQVRDSNRIAKPTRDNPQRTSHIPKSTQLPHSQAQESGALGPVISILQEAPMLLELRLCGSFTFRLGPRLLVSV